jgi:hypothetical protein
MGKATTGQKKNDAPDPLVNLILRKDFSMPIKTYNGGTHRYLQNSEYISTILQGELYPPYAKKIVNR